MSGEEALNVGDVTGLAMSSSAGTFPFDVKSGTDRKIKLRGLYVAETSTTSGKRLVKRFENGKGEISGLVAYMSYLECEDIRKIIETGQNLVFTLTTIDEIWTFDGILEGQLEYDGKESTLELKITTASDIRVTKTTLI